MENSPSELARYFFELTPDRILRSVEQVGVRCTGRLLALNSMENRVFEVEIEARGEVKSRYDTFRVAKFYRPGRWSKEQILEEHEFLRELAEEEIPVAAPLPFEDGSTLRKMDEAEIYFCVYPRIGGRHLDEPQLDQLKHLGWLLSRLHAVGRRHPFIHRIALNEKSYGFESLDFLEKSKMVTDTLAARFFDVAKNVCRLCGERLGGLIKLRTHGDLHWGNILWDREKALFVDLDDSSTGPAVQDLWLLVPGREDEDRRRLDRIISGYESFRDFDRRELSAIEALRSLRIINYSAWIARRWEDPSFKRNFPEFGTLPYWRDLLITIEEQAGLV